MGCEAYKDDSEMEGDHQCPTHKTRCVERQEENYFFALSKYQQQIQVPAKKVVFNLRIESLQHHQNAWQHMRLCYWSHDNLACQAHAGHSRELLESYCDKEYWLFCHGLSQEIQPFIMQAAHAVGCLASQHRMHTCRRTCSKPGCVCAQRLIEEDKSFVQPAARRNEVLGWVGEGLRDFSISRAAVSWGIPIPRDPAQTVYVWFDALLGYMSGAVPPLLSLSFATACRCTPGS